MAPSQFVIGKLLACLVVTGVLGPLAPSYAADSPKDNLVNPAQLAALIKKADRIVVFEDTRKARKLFSSTNRKDIEEFGVASAVVRPDGFFFCQCSGTLDVHLYRNGTELLSMTNHHGITVSCSLWLSDASLKDSQQWLAWFDARKMLVPRREFEQMAALARQHEIDYARWLEAMPQSIRAVWEKAAVGAVDPDPDPIRLALVETIPNLQQRVLALFSWYGSGAGPWSGFPSYEDTVEKLLLGVPTADLIAVAQSENLSETQIEGVARLFGGWTFSKQRPDDLKKLPDALKRKLLEHSLKSTDRDKRGRAKDAFE
jgi:hypothetical protein